MKSRTGMRVNVWLLAGMVSSLACASAGAAVSFYGSPDGQLGTADPSRDLAFQGALTSPFTELEFNAYGHEYVMEPSTLMAGTVNVRPNLLDAAGNNAANLAVNGSRLIETYPFVPNIPGIIAGLVNPQAPAPGAALMSRTYAGNFADVDAAGIEFTFSSPVEGFGAWIMDDFKQASQFVLKVTEVGGAVSTSSPLESGNGTTLAIEGFLGAVSNLGITRVVIEQQTLAGVPTNADWFYLDHVQVGGIIPEPGSLLLLSLGALGLLRRRR